MIDPVTTPVLLFVEVSGGPSRLSVPRTWDASLLDMLAIGDHERLREWIRTTDMEPCDLSFVSMFGRLVAILDAIIHLDILALQSCDVGRLASAVRDDLSALPALLDALEETGRGNDRRVVAVLGDTGVIA